MLQRERDALLEHVRELEDDAAEQRDAVAAAEDRAEDAEARARWAEEQRAKSLESLASCMAEAGLLKHELETLRVDALRARDEAPRVDVDAAVDLRHRPAPGSEAARLEYFLSDLGLSGDYGPKLRELGAKKVFDGAGKACDVGQLQTAPLSVVSHSFRLMFRRAIISRSDLDRECLSLERARAEHSC